MFLQSPNDKITYEAVSTPTALQYFSVNSVTGAVSVKSPLTSDGNIFYEVNSEPSRINVLRVDNS